MKRIAIFIDGTWNRPDAEHPTNVLRLSRCVKHHDREMDIGQHVIYSPGVGSGRGNTKLGRKLDHIFGGALGWGLLDIIEETYRNLIFAYEPGDDIYVFGFSRGAFAARSLVGLIRSCGIPPRSHLARIPEAIARYVAHTEETKPEHPHSYEFRADFAPATATSQSEYNWRRKRGDTDAIRLVIPYLGIWDTVGAMGVPAFLPMAKTINHKYLFHDTRLSSSVLSARHAIAIDERRKTFPTHPWSNINELNAKHADQHAAPTHLQQWFPGNHGSVGGGGARIGLSSIAMHWVALGAQEAGLVLNWEDFDRQAWDLSIDEVLNNQFGPVGLSGALMNALTTDRPGPMALDELSLATLDRWRQDADYRPKTLENVRPLLNGMSAEDWENARERAIKIGGGRTHDLTSRIRPRDVG